MLQAGRPRIQTPGIGFQICFISINQSGLGFHPRRAHWTILTSTKQLSWTKCICSCKDSSPNFQFIERTLFLFLAKVTAGTKYPSPVLYVSHVLNLPFPRHYAPILSTLIQVRQPMFPINLKGIAIGDGWIDPRIQYGAYIDFGLQNGLVPPSLVAELHMLNSRWDSFMVIYLQDQRKRMLTVTV